ncbi:MAG: 16S rRNA (adenine(1518)-N(6)/adenine(1519)-N(6))-dimethyltransferase RsmA [Candidatus Micrarchaeia archaeon]
MLRKELIEIFERYSIHPKKRLSQSFLVDERVIRDEVEFAEADGKEVLEIGAGVGFLTRALAERAKKVMAVEKDSRLVEVLRDTMPPSVEVVEVDFLNYEIPSAEVIVSNVPYSISSSLLFKISEMKFERALLCFQEEFARRMVAQPNTSEYSRLSVMSQLKFKLKLLRRVSKGCFFPIPKVNSRLILLEPTGRVIDGVSKELINLLFQHRNRTLRSSLLCSARNLGVEKNKLKQIVNSLPFKNRRVNSLNQTEILQLVENEKLRGVLS